MPERWHLIRRGRIVQTAWSSNGDCAERELNPSIGDLLMSDTDWRDRHWRRALVGRTNAFTPTPLQLLTLARHA
jgi:hypothetical protein